MTKQYLYVYFSENKILGDASRVWKELRKRRPLHSSASASLFAPMRSSSTGRRVGGKITRSCAANKLLNLIYDLAGRAV